MINSSPSTKEFLSKVRPKKLPETCNKDLHVIFKVVAEHDGGSLSSGTLSTITASRKLGADIFNNPVAEDIALALQSIMKLQVYTHVFAPCTHNGKNFIPRLAAMMNCSPLTDVIEVIDENTFKRPMYAGNAICTVRMTDPIKFLLIRPTAFPTPTDVISTVAAFTQPTTNNTQSQPQTTVSIEHVSLESLDSFPANLSSFVSKKDSNSNSLSSKPDLTSARVVVAGGRGLQSKENFKLLDDLASKLGGAVGASRAAVDAGFIANEFQIGQSGKVVAPDLYIAVGISGAIQHISGIQDSKTIVAINKDKDAPIFQVTDYGLVGDLFTILPDITSKL
eukprot:gene8507-17544_t